MSAAHRRPAAGLIFVLLILSGCSRGYGGGADERLEGGSSAAGSMEQHFAENVQPRLDFCRSCHVPGGIGDVDHGRDFQLSPDESQDFENLRDSWERLGGNDPTSRILLMASGRETPHTGGAPWPPDSEAYRDMDLLLQCFADPDNCSAILAGQSAEAPAAESEFLPAP